jgi:hypothetical protein
MTQDVKYLRPAHEKADIPDPSHGNKPLPYEEQGVPRVYDAYWAGHIMRGDVVVLPAPDAEPVAPDPAPAPEAADEQAAS